MHKCASLRIQIREMMKILTLIELMFNELNVTSHLILIVHSHVGATTPMHN